MPSLFDPIQLGDLYLPNRIFMAPLTRLRGTPDHIPTPIMIDYYTQRAGAGLIISEGTPIDPLGVGYASVPGLWSQQQTEAWKPITAAVHNAGGHIYSQIWHVGRISDPEFLNGQLPVAPSAIAAAGTVSLLRPQRPFVTPRALRIEEIKGIVEAFRRGAQNAQAAGFDGVELHGANGYLLDQFLQDGSNRRTDAYGGAVENRARLPLEVTKAVIDVWGADRVGYRISPNGDFNSMSDSNPIATFSYFAERLNKLRVVYLHVVDPVADGAKRVSRQLRRKFDRTYIVN